MPCTLPPLTIPIIVRRNAFNDFVNHHKTEIHREQMKRRVHTREEDAVNPPRVFEASAGEKRLRDFEDILENGYTWKRGRFQREFHDNVTNVMASSLVGVDDWAKIGTNIAKARGWTRQSKLILGKAPRRFGKSSSVAMIAIARSEVLIARNDSARADDLQAIFSTGRRASTNLGQYCYRFAQERALDTQIVKYTEETLWIQGPSGFVAKIFFYPSNAKTLR